MHIAIFLLSLEKYFDETWLIFRRDKMLCHRVNSLRGMAKKKKKTKHLNQEEKKSENVVLVCFTQPALHNIK